MRLPIPSGRASRLVLALVLAAQVVTGVVSSAQPPALPGVGDGTLTPETLFEFTRSIKMIQPPPGLPQKWFSAQAELTGSVATAATESVVIFEPMTVSEHAGRRLRVTGPSPAAGQIRMIVDNTTNQIEVTPPFDVLPEAGDSVEIFTGQLAPGRWNGACTQTDPCLDVRGAYELAAAGAVWLWFDSGDVWDGDDEWCDATNSTALRCPDPPDPFFHRIIAEEHDSPGIENDIRLGVSGTDLTGQTYAVFDCDANLNYPPFGGGVFENQNGSAAGPANDHPTAWMVVQGMETRCWNRPAPGSLTERNEWGEGTGIYKREFSGKILAIHNRHGELWDDAALVSGNGGSFTQGDLHQGGVILVDVEVDTADYSQMVGQCVATNTPFRSCQGLEFSGDNRGLTGADIRPRFVSAQGGGHLLWIGGDRVYRNRSSGSYAGNPRHFVEAAGFNDYVTDSGVGGSQNVTLVNLQLEGSPDDLAPADVVMAIPFAGRWGTTFRVRIVNSRFTEMPDGSAIVHFQPGWVANRATDTTLLTDWVNVDVERYGRVLAKDLGALGTDPEMDGGFEWTGRCLFVDEANPTLHASRVLNIQSSFEDLSTRCKRHFIDVEGWIDGDDVANQFHLCEEDTVSYASEAMTGTMMQPGHAGDVNGWRIFSHGNSGDWGGEGVEVDARAELDSSPEVQSAVLETCAETQVFPLGQTLPIGFVSTAENLITDIVVDGVRDLGFNPFWGQPPCIAPGSQTYLPTMTRTPGGAPVIHVTDPNPATEVTGYNVYRATAGNGAWTVIGMNVADADPVTPGVQFTDETGHPGSPWFYQVAATDGACEGPW